VLLFYALLFGGTLAWPRLSWVPAFLKRSLLLAGLGATTVVVWQTALAAPDGRLHLTLLDVGGGDALLVQTPGGRAVLIDGDRTLRGSRNAWAGACRWPNGSFDWLVVGA
jgi:beta-lactamase superfamily II metal-dependent hydrolase